MAYLGKNYERDFQQEFFKYVSKLKNNGSISDLVLKQDLEPEEHRSWLSTEVEELKTNPCRGWLETKRSHIVESLNRENSKPVLSGTKR